MDMQNMTLKGKISVASVVGGVVALAMNPGVLALLPPPWGMILSVFVSGAATGGVFYNMDPKKTPETKP